MNRSLSALQTGWSLQYLEYNLNHVLGVILIKCILFNVLRLMQAPTLYDNLQKLIAIYWFESHPKEHISSQSILTSMYLQWLYWKVTEKCFDLNADSFYQMLQDHSATLKRQLCKILFLTEREKKPTTTKVVSNKQKNYWSAQTVLIFIWTHDSEKVKYPVLRHAWSTDLKWNPLLLSPMSALYD